MKKIIFTLLLTPVLLFAQESSSLTIGDRTIEYERSSQFDGSTYYYIGTDLVASEHDGVSLVYESDAVVLEAHDTDNDGTPDTFLEIDTAGEVKSVTGQGSEAFVRPETIEFVELLEGEGSGSFAAAPDNADLVGSLDSIKIPKYHNWKLYGLIIVLIGGGVWWYRKKRK